MTRAFAMEVSNDSSRRIPMVSAGIKRRRAALTLYKAGSVHRVLKSAWATYTPRTIMARGPLREASPDRVPIQIPGSLAPSPVKNKNTPTRVPITRGLQNPDKEKALFFSVITLTP